MKDDEMIEIFMEPVKVKNLIDKLDCQMEGWRQFYNKKTGSFVEIQEQYLGIAEELDEEDDISNYQDWEQEEIEEAMDIFENEDDYIELPDRYEIHEYKIMEDFSYTIEDENLRNRLCNAISGRGAFRLFKDTIARYGLEDSWYSYKDKALGQLAKDWCEANDIPWVEE